jgi:hypothetical protein
MAPRAPARSRADQKRSAQCRQNVAGPLRFGRQGVVISGLSAARMAPFVAKSCQRFPAGTLHNVLNQLRNRRSRRSGEVIMAP